MVRILCIAAMTMATATSALAAPDSFVYRGNRLKPESGSGVPGVSRLHFMLSGTIPKKGTCRENMTVVAISDGAYSLRELLAHGFMFAPGNKVKVCSDARTGALSETLSVTLNAFVDGNLSAAYTWRSGDPRHGKLADTVMLYANIEYHISGAKKAGHFSDMPEPAGAALAH